MTTILDDQLYTHSERLVGKVVLITGEKDAPQRVLFPIVFSFPSFMQGARPELGEKPPCSTPGRSASFRLALHRLQRLMTSVINQFHSAKLVLGDLNEPGLEKIVSEIRRAGGYA